MKYNKKYLMNIIIIVKFVEAYNNFSNKVNLLKLPN